MKDAVKAMARAIETLVRVETTQVAHSKQLHDQEGRLRKVEEKQPGLVEMRLWIIGGFAAVALLLIGAVVAGSLHITIVR